MLCSLIDSMSSRTQRARLRRGHTQRDAVDRTAHEQLAIASAIRDRQPEAAAWTAARIAGVEAWLRNALRDQDENGALEPAF